jgi:hypothetical protein
MVLVLFPLSEEEPALPQAALAALARLGVTSVSLLRDDRLAGLVLEGWAFDPARACEAAHAAVRTRHGIRTLRPLMHMALSATTAGELNQITEGERR